jgi:hypothetical protein
VNVRTEPHAPGEIKTRQLPGLLDGNQAVYRFKPSVGLCNDATDRALKVGKPRTKELKPGQGRSLVTLIKAKAGV